MGWNNPCKICGWSCNLYFIAGRGPTLWAIARICAWHFVHFLPWTVSKCDECKRLRKWPIEIWAAELPSYWDVLLVLSKWMSEPLCKYVAYVPQIGEVNQLDDSRVVSRMVILMGTWIILTFLIGSIIHGLFILFGWQFLESNWIYWDVPGSDSN